MISKMKKKKLKKQIERKIQKFQCANIHWKMSSWYRDVWRWDHGHGLTKYIYKQITCYGNVTTTAI